MTAATVTLAPGPQDGPGPGATADDTVTLTCADFARWERQLSRDRHLLTPGPAQGPHRRHRPGHRRSRPVYDTATEPGGVLHVACGNRREAVCPACSQVYKRDARQLVRAG